MREGRRSKSSIILLLECNVFLLGERGILRVKIEGDRKMDAEGDRIKSTMIFLQRHSALPRHSFSFFPGQVSQTSPSNKSRIIPAR